MNWFQKLGQIPAKILPSQLWYHGTDSLTAYSFIHEMILKPRSETGETSYEGSLSSIPSSVYLSSSPGKAAKHAIERSEKIKGSNPVILVIQPESLGFVHVDEDFVHHFLSGHAYFDETYYPSPSLEKEIFEMAAESLRLDSWDIKKSDKQLVLEYFRDKEEFGFPDDIEDEYLREEGIVPDESGLYEYDESMHLSKEIAAALNGKHQKEAIMNFGNLAHQGRIRASEIYLVPEKIERKMDDGEVWLEFSTSLKSYEDLKEHAQQIDPRQLLMPFMKASNNDWFQKIAQTDYQGSFLFLSDEERKPWSVELESKLLELFRTEYVISELRRRQQVTPELQFSKRTSYWISKLTDHAKNLADDVALEILHHLDYWLEFHSGSGFTERIIGEKEGEGSYINDDGVISLGGDFSFDLKDDVIESFLREDPQFVELLLDDERESRQGEDPEYQQDFNNWTDEDKLQYVKNNIIEIYGENWHKIENLFGPGINEIIKEVLQNEVYPAWRQYWMTFNTPMQKHTIQVAEQQVQSARNELEKAINQGNLGELLAAISVALNAEHVHGRMSGRMDISEKTLDKLSNLDTRKLDDFVNKITGAYHWGSSIGWFKKVFADKATHLFHKYKKLSFEACKKDKFDCDSWLKNQIQFAIDWNKKYAEWLLYQIIQNSIKNTNFYIDRMLNRKLQELNDYLVQGNGFIPSHRTTFEEAIALSDEWHRKISEQEGEYTTNQVVGELPDGWKIVNVPEEDAGAEGYHMGHCVGSYCSEIKSGDVQILSIRDPNNQPHITIELGYQRKPTSRHQVIRTGMRVIEQIKGKENKAQPKYADLIEKVLDLLESQYQITFGETGFDDYRAFQLSDDKVRERIDKLGKQKDVQHFSPIFQLHEYAKHGIDDDELLRFIENDENLQQEIIKQVLDNANSFDFYLVTQLQDLGEDQEELIEEIESSGELDELDEEEQKDLIGSIREGKISLYELPESIESIVSRWTQVRLESGYDIGEFAIEHYRDLVTTRFLDALNIGSEYDYETIYNAWKNYYDKKRREEKQRRIDAQIERLMKQNGLTFPEHLRSHDIANWTEQSRVWARLRQYFIPNESDQRNLKYIRRILEESQREYESNLQYQKKRDQQFQEWLPRIVAVIPGFGQLNEFDQSQIIGGIDWKPDLDQEALDYIKVLTDKILQKQRQVAQSNNILKIAGVKERIEFLEDKYGLTENQFQEHEATDDVSIAEEIPDEQFIEEDSLPVVTPQNIGTYLEPEEDLEREPIRPEEAESFVEEIPEEEITLDTRRLLENAINSNQCVLFEYTTKKGNYVGVRIVEPYTVFFAYTTGNEILVTWDRTMNGIRAFIISDFNISPGSVKTLPGDFYHFEKDKFIFRA